MIARNRAVFRRRSLSFKQKRWLFLQCATLALACLTGASVSALAQDQTKPSAEKWRPKAGTYALPGKDFIDRCGEFGDVIVSLAEKDISGNEWSCEVTKLTDTAPGAIKLDMTCNDYNLAEDIHDPNPEERKFKEVMLLRKKDENSIFVRRTQNGQFKGPEARASYCPEKWQRAYIESRARDRAEAKQKATEEKLSLNPWRPLEGIYATSGANFDDQCRKGGDATIALSERSIVSGADKCNVTFIRNEPDAVKLFATCNQPPNAPVPMIKTANGGLVPAPSSSETIILKKVDDKTVFIQKSTNGNFADAGRQLAYCGQDAQKMHEQQKTAK